MALVQCDLLGGSSVVQHLVARAIAERTDIPLAGLMIGATHTHAGPGQFLGTDFYNRFASNRAGFDPAWTAFLVDRITDAVVEAHDSRSPAVAGLRQHRRVGTDPQPLPRPARAERDGDRQAHGGAAQVRLGQPQARPAPRRCPRRRRPATAAGGDGDLQRARHRHLDAFPRVQRRPVGVPVRRAVAPHHEARRIECRRRGDRGNPCRCGTGHPSRHGRPCGGPADRSGHRSGGGRSVDRARGPPVERHRPRCRPARGRPRHRSDHRRNDAAEAPGGRGGAGRRCRREPHPDPLAHPAVPGREPPAPRAATARRPRNG